MLTPWLLLNWNELIGWQQLPNPPEETAEILSYDQFDNEVHVNTTSNRLYACNFSRKTIFNQTCTPLQQPNSTPSYPLTFSPDFCAGKTFPTPKPPGRIEAELEAHPCVAEGYLQVNVILLEDGTIWGSSTAQGDLEIGFAMLCSPIAGIIGLLVGSIVGLNLQRFGKLRDE